MLQVAILNNLDDHCAKLSYDNAVSNMLLTAMRPSRRAERVLQAGPQAVELLAAAGSEASSLRLAATAPNWPSLLAALYSREKREQWADTAETTP